MRRLFLDAFGEKKLSAPPVWIMRQAGRYLPEYRQVRSKFEDFMDMCRNADACCEVALQPLRRYDLDAAIVFSDILTIPEALGLDLKFVKGVGPIFNDVIKSEEDLRNFASLDEVNHKLSYVYNAVKTTKKAINVPLIGFTGSPWTLSAYMVEGQGSKQFNKLRKMMYSQPQLMHKLLSILSETIVLYLKEQIRAGADSLMIFDTWGGVLPVQQYKEFSLNYMNKIANDVKSEFPNIPIVFFTKGGGMFLEEYANSLCDGIGIDWNITLPEARNKVGNKFVLQGNFDPAFLYASDKQIQDTVRHNMDFIKQDEKNNYIVNLGHGIYPDVDPEKVKVMVDAIRQSTI
ncbi:uroporphyrinogen decarboxylase [Francisella frigiditurris]|uniref:Uroporphyrinogen decarboxylase n=1 Tax=Francisella frigiditurris TaxID=1542390 RepID=A0A1J0KRY5_9GAMM|nr:uroporphyrinogen decarboxylase [Francisella frigiditurris]APC96458.1 uroporphyrinogen decarboxylase [Francisella frigiditurris]